MVNFLFSHQHLFGAQSFLFLPLSFIFFFLCPHIFIFIYTVHAGCLYVTLQMYMKLACLFILYVCMLVFAQIQQAHFSRLLTGFVMLCHLCRACTSDLIKKRHIIIFRELTHAIYEFERLLYVSTTLPHSDTLLIYTYTHTHTHTHTHTLTHTHRQTDKLK